MQFGCGAFAEIIHVSAQPVTPSRRDDLIDRSVRLGVAEVDRPRGPGDHRAVHEPVDLVGVERPVLADHGRLPLQQLGRRVQLLLRQLVRVGDPEVRVVRHQVHRRVGDVDRGVVRGDLARVRVRRAVQLRLERDVPAGGRRRHDVGVVHQEVRTVHVRHAVHVCRRRRSASCSSADSRLQRRDHVGEVPGRAPASTAADVAAGDQPVRRVARRRHAVVRRIRRPDASA